VAEVSVSPFQYPQRHRRRHAPAGYVSYQDYKPWLRDEFQFRCVYCLHREKWSRDGADIFGVDHLLAQSSAEGRELITEYINLVYCCNRCNSHKQGQFFFDPCEKSLEEDIVFLQDGTIEAITELGIEIVDTLNLDSPKYVAERRRILQILADYEADPDDPIHIENYLREFGYPVAFSPPNRADPPGGNMLPEGAASCFYSQRQAGTLNRVY
jgi:hypothetical protein